MHVSNDSHVWSKRFDGLGTGWRTRGENESDASEAIDLDPRPLLAPCLILIFGYIKVFLMKASIDLETCQTGEVRKWDQM